MATNYDEILTKEPQPDKKYAVLYWRTIRHWSNAAMVNVSKPDTREHVRVWPDGAREVLGSRRRVAPPYIQRKEDGYTVYVWVDKFGGIETLKERRPL